MNAVTGEYEVHITVLLEEAAEFSRLEVWAQERGFKYTQILLDRGKTCLQPMLTTARRGVLPEVQTFATAISEEISRTGFVVMRIKIEAAPGNVEVPRSQEEALAQPPGRYFEHHVKLLLGPGVDRKLLAETAMQHNGHLSRNARKQRGDDCEERFVTQRCVGVDQPEARRQWKALLHALSPLGHTLLESEEEFVVYDSNVKLDAEWLPHAGDYLRSEEPSHVV